MGTLKNCLKRIGLEAHEQAIINGAVQDNLADGYTANEAATAAVKDYISQLQDERKDIDRQIKEKAPAAAEPAELTSIKDIEEKWQAQGVDLSLFDNKHPSAKPSISLMHISVPKDMRKKGIGTKVMRDITEYADKTGQRVTLTPAVRDDGFGTTSRARLVKFYKHFGFVQNKGRNKDFRINESMYRDPKQAAAQAGPERQTETARFKKWFKKSKVVDSKGAPLVVYHGTDVDIDFSKFDTKFGAHFGSEGQASARIGTSPEMVKNIIEQGGPAAYQERRRIFPVYLSIQNPKRVMDHGGNWGQDIEDAKAAGYDGIVYKNRFEDRGKGGDSWIIFEPTQVKSAIGNTGKFSSTNKDILASVKRPYAELSNQQLGIGAGRKNKYQAELQVTVKYKDQDPWQDAIGGYNLEHALERARRNWPGAEITPGQLTRPGEAILASIKTDTPEFKKWFGKSKVVDANGDPMVVYHGTFTEFDRFKRRIGDIGMHFGTAEAASDRVDYLVPHRQITGGARVLPVYLRITNPLRLHDAGFWNAENLNWKLKELFPKDAEKFGPGRRGTKGITTTKQLRDFIKSKGYDGIVYRNTGEVGGSDPFRRKIEAAKAEMEKVWPKSKNSFSPEDQKRPEYIAWSKAQKEYTAHREASAEDSWIAFEPTQIKSAIANTGKFSPTKADITASIKKLKAQVDTPAFKKWFKKSQIVDDAGKPLMVYHGSTHDFTIFSLRNATSDSFLGKGFYFTSSIDDVNANYAGEGPDLTNRIEMAAEEYQDLDQDQEDELLADYFDANPDIEVGAPGDALDAAIKWAARQNVAGPHEGAVYPAFLKMENPLYLDDVDGHDATQFSIETVWDENQEEVIEETGNGVDLINALRDILLGYDVRHKVANDILDNVYQVVMGGASASEVREVLGEYAHDISNPDDGSMVGSGAIMREVAEALGHDGVVMNAERHFGARLIGGGLPVPGMKGVAAAVHYLPFHPEQIKSAIGNTGKFDPRNADITASLKMNPDSQLGIPEFIGTKDAIAFGVTATIGQISEMRKLAIDIRANSAKLLSEGRAANDMEKFEASVTQAYRAQFLDEAVDAAEGDAERMISLATFGRTELVSEGDTKLEDPKFSVKMVQFSTRQKVKMYTTGNIAAAGNVILNVDDAASLIAGIRKAAQENAYSIVTGEDGTVLEIHRYGKGTANAAYVNANEIVGRVFNIPGASNIYFVHNHPSGGVIASASDVQMTLRLEKIAAANGLRTYSFIIAGTKYIDISSPDSSENAQKAFLSWKYGKGPSFGSLLPIRPTVRKVTIPVKERYLVKTGEGPGTSVYSPTEMKAWIDKYHPNDAGIAFLDFQNNIVGWMNSISHLTPIKAFTEIYKGAESTGSAAVMFISPTKMSSELRRVISQISKGIGEVKVLDVVEEGKSMAETGELANIIGAFADEGTAISRLAETKKTLKKMGATFSLKRTDIKRAIDRGAFSDEDIRIASDLETLARIDESMNLGGGGNPQVHAQNINKWLDKNGYAVWRLRQIEDFSRVKLLDSSGHMIMDVMESKTKVKPFGIPDTPETEKKERKPSDVNFPEQGEIVPLYPGFARSWVQTYFDALDPIRRESFRSAVSNSIEAAYRGLEKAAVGELGVTFENLGAKKDYAIPRPVRIAHKTMATLNLNQQCPMMSIGAHGCYLDGCYVVGQGIGGQVVNYYRSAMYTAELLQLTDAEVKRLNGAGGLRLNGNGDTSMADLAQWRDVFKHAEMRGLVLKIITKQDDTMAVIDQLRKEGSRTAAETVIQTSMDPYWIEVKTYDDVPGSGANREGAIAAINSGNLEEAARIYRDVFHREAKVVNGKLFRKYGYSWEQMNKLGKQYPKLRFLPRVVVSTPKEIADYALRLPEVLQTWMHAKLRPGMWSDIMGAPVDAEHGALNFGSQIAIKKVDGEWRILRQVETGSLAVTEGPQYTAVEEYIKTNFNKKDQDKIFNTLSGHLKKEPSSLCCQISASKDACMTCQSTCANGSFYTGTQMVKMSQRGMEGLAMGIQALGRENAILASLKGPDPAPGPVWYSRMEQHLGEKLPNRIDAGGLWPLLKSFVTGGKISGEELDWSGIEDWLKGQSGKVSKQQIMDYLSSNNIRVEEVLYGPGRYRIVKNEDGEFDVLALDKLILGEPQVKFTGLTEAEAQEYINEEVSLVPGLTPRHQSQNLRLPGGENYRELVLTLKVGGPTVEKHYVIGPSGNRMGTYYTADEAIAAAKALNVGLPQGGYKAESKTVPKAIPFTGSHYPQDNVLAHIRFNERTVYESAGEKDMIIQKTEGARPWKVYVEGEEQHQSSYATEEEAQDFVSNYPKFKDSVKKRILFIEEVQSDWHQRGRQPEEEGGGYKAQDPDKIKKLREELDAANAAVKAVDEKAYAEWKRRADAIEGGASILSANIPPNLIASAVGMDEERTAALTYQLNVQYDLDHPNETGGVPDAPFKNSWQMLAMKRMVRWAAEENFDRIAWTTGAQQIARYEDELRRNVDRISWTAGVEGFRTVTAYEGSRTVFEGILNSRGVFTDGAAGGRTVNEVLGKTMGAQVMDKTSGSLSGENLSIGGQIHKFIYDVNIPQEMSKFFGKATWGNARVGTTEIKTGLVYPKSGMEIAGVTTPLGEYTRTELARIADAVRDDVTYGVGNVEEMNRGEWRKGMDLAEEIERGDFDLNTPINKAMLVANFPTAATLLKKRPKVAKLETVHSMDITPEMREKSVRFGMPLFSLKAPRQSPFYSQMEDLIRERNLSGPPSEVSKAIRAWARKGDVKDEEVQWSGILRYVEGKTAPDKITTKNLLTYLEDNNIRIVEIEKNRENEIDYSLYDLIAPNFAEDGELPSIDWKPVSKFPDGFMDGGPQFREGFEMKRLNALFPGLTREQIDLFRYIRQEAYRDTYPGVGAYGQEGFEPTGKLFASHTFTEAVVQKIKDYGTDHRANLPGGEWTIVAEVYDHKNGEAEKVFKVYRRDPEGDGGYGETIEVGIFDSVDEAMDSVDENDLADILKAEGFPGAFPRYPQYVQGVSDAEEAGDSYRELLLIIPTKQNDEHAARSKRVKELIAERDAIPNRPGAALEYRRRWSEIDAQIDRLMSERSVYGAFKGGHWDEENVVVHIRMTERISKDGTELYVEEIQSDWHQQARKSMYKTGLRQQNFSTWLKQKGIEWDDSVQAQWDDRSASPDKRSPLINEYFAEQKMAMEEAQKGVPDAPFKHSWALLAVKRMVRYAAEKGYSRLNWSTGDLEHTLWGSERFDWNRISEPAGGVPLLSTWMAELAFMKGDLIAYHEFGSPAVDEYYEQVDRKSAFWQDDSRQQAVRAGEGEWVKGFVDQDGKIPGRTGWVVFLDEQWGGDVFAGQEEALSERAKRNSIFIPDSWGERAGKAELRHSVDKTIDREKEKFTKEKWEKKVDSVTDKIWNGMQSMETGRYLPRWEGFKGFYDDILVKEVNKFFNRPEWGNAKVTTNEIFIGRNDLDADDQQMLASGIQSGDTETKTVWSLPITPVMRSRALEKGMPAFSLKKIEPPGDSYLDAVNSVLGTAVVSTTKDTDVDPYGGLDQGIKDSMMASKGVKSATRWQKLKQEGKDIWYSATRHRPYLDPADNGQITDILRTHQETGENAVRRAMQILEHIISGLKPKQYEIFSLSLIMDDMAKDVQSGLLENKQALPFGFNEQKMLDYQAYLHSAISADPAISAALRRRKTFQTKLRKALVAADLLHKDVLNDDRYFHHQVLQYRSYQEDKITYEGIGVQSKDVRMQRKGWQKGRIGSVAEYNTSYAESEFEVISQGLAQLETMHTMVQIKKLSDIMPELKSQAKHQNYVAIVGGQANYDRLVELRGQKAAIQQNEPLDSADRKMIKQINDEIRALDPTMPFRSKIAMGYARLAKALGLDVDPDMDLEEGELGMKTIAKYAGLKDEVISMPARTIMKAIADRSKFIKDTLGRDFKTAKSLMPDGYVPWMPSKGQSWYKAFTITDRLVAAINEGEETLGKENADKIKAVLVKAQNPEWIIPAGLAKTLDGYDQQYENHWMSKRSRQVMSGWKSWTLMSPPRVLRYNLNNMSGDLDIVIAYRPEIFYKYFWKAFGDLSREGDMAWKKDKDVSAGLRAELDKAYELSVLGSGWSVQEVSDVAGQLAMKQRLDAMMGNDPNLVEKYWETTKKYTQFRENLLRLAAFRYFKDQIAQGKKVYGASDRAEVDGITDPDRRAAKLARELLGDYGNITHAGLWMRAHAMPFYSWMEVNAPRYVRLMRNLPHEEGAGMFGAPRIVAAAGAKVAGAAAMKSLPLLMKMAGFYALVSLWNHWRFPDEEDELGESQRAQMHLILGRRDDGSIITMRVQGAFSDAVSWFGLETAVADVTKMIQGKKSISDQAKSMLLATPKKLIGAVRPDVKMFAELSTGKSLYPDPFNPGTVRDRAEYLARTFSLDSAYRWAIGRPQRGDTLGRQLFNGIANLLTYTSDPGEMAYYDSTRLGHDWINKNKPDAKDKADALYYWKQSMKFGDLKAGDKYMRQYYEYGGTEQGLNQSIKKAHPMGMLSKKDQAAFKESLSPAELQRLELAIEWYERTYKSEAAEASRANARGEIVEDEPPPDNTGGMTLRDAFKLK